MTKKLSLIISILIDLSLGGVSFYLSLICEESWWLVLASLSTVYFCRVYRKPKIPKAKEPTDPAELIQYEDRGQLFQYDVFCNGDIIRCFSNKYLGPNEPVDLIDMLVKDGKIKISEGMTVNVKITVRSTNA